METCKYEIIWNVCDIDCVVFGFWRSQKTREMSQRLEMFCGFLRSLILFSLDGEGNWES
jgi:hypothetical protein